MNDVKLESLIGKTLFSVRGMEVNSGRVTLCFTDMTSVELFHEQDCCESVELVDVAGDVVDLIGEPLLMCEETTSDVPDEYGESMETWYKFATNSGAVTLRWLGSSNGYYGISVTSVEDKLKPSYLSYSEAVARDAALEGASKAAKAVFAGAAS